MVKLSFPEDFLWGAATSSYQIEGAVAEDGRKPSIWDTFCAQPGRIANGDDGAMAADSYHKIEEDVNLMSKIGLKAYRFSIAWPRVIPDGEGEVNKAGLAYYQKLCQELRKHGIEPVPTLYHWDLPQSLEDQGGWRNRQTAYAFATYAQACFAALGKYVDKWITINEPWCVAYLGHLTAEHAPGHTSFEETVNVIHHVNLAHGLAVAAFRKMKCNGKVGISWNLMLHRAVSASPNDTQAAKLAEALESRVFTDPVLKGTYPELVEHEYGMNFPVEPGDMALISLPIDFIGINYYNEEAISYDPTSLRKYKMEPHWQRETAQRWPIVPYGLFRILRWITQEAGAGIPLYITENGCAVNDMLDEHGRIHDLDRIKFLFSHFEVCQQAIEEGIPLKGFFVWSLLDNFEWSWGYQKRFGIVYVDFNNHMRTMKDSAYFYRDVIQGYIEQPQ